MDERLCRLCCLDNISDCYNLVGIQQSLTMGMRSPPSQRLPIFTEGSSMLQ
jgi:hypothetical protein